MFSLKIEKQRRYKARNLKLIRESKGVKLIDLSKACGVSNSYISQVEAMKITINEQMKENIETQLNKLLQKKKVILRKKNIC